METKKYAPADFAKALKNNELSANTPLTLTGMVKLDEKDPSVILFAPRGCETWVPVPISSIHGDVEDLGSRTCRDHTHRYVRFHLKDSPSVEAGILREMLRSGATTDAGLLRRDTTPHEISFRAEGQVYPQIAVRGQAGGFDCEKACSICRRYPWKTGPCSVCDNYCGGEFEDFAFPTRQRTHFHGDDCETNCSEFVADCLASCGGPGCKMGCMRWYRNCVRQCSG